MLPLRSFYRKMSVKWKFLMILTGLLFLVFLISMSALSLAFSLYDRQILKISSEILNLDSTNLENELRKIDALTFSFITESKTQASLKTINLVASSYEKYQAIEAVKNKLFLASQSESYISSVSYFDNEGHEYTVGNSVTPYSASYLRWLFAELDAKEGAMAWFAPMESDSSFIAAREIRGSDDLKPIGYVVVRVHPRTLVNWVSSTWPEFRSQLSIVSTDGATIYRDPRLEEMHGLPPLPPRQNYQIVKVNEQKYLQTELTSSYTGWTYANFISYESIFKGILLTRTIMVTAFVVLFLVVVLIGIKFAGSITKPIIHLSKKMRKIESGDFQIAGLSGDRSESGDEIVQLRNEFAIMIEKIDSLIQENYVKQLLVKESELKALQAQINPHFLYNTLESINWEARINKQHKISTMAKALGSLLRRAVDQKRQVTMVEEELQLVEDYITIQKFRFEERLEFHADVDAKAKRCEIVKMSLQPLVENAIKYGLEKRSGVCRIRIDSKTEGNLVKIAVSDNGPGMSPEYLDRLRRWEIRPQGTGIGLHNIDQRLRLTFGESSGLEIASREGEGTVVTVKLCDPLEGEEHVSRTDRG